MVARGRLGAGETGATCPQGSGPFFCLSATCQGPLSLAEKVCGIAYEVDARSAHGLASDIRPGGPLESTVSAGWTPRCSRDHSRVEMFPCFMARAGAPAVLTQSGRDAAVVHGQGGGRRTGLPSMTELMFPMFSSLTADSFSTTWICRESFSKRLLATNGVLLEKTIC